MFFLVKVGIIFLVWSVVVIFRDFRVVWVRRKGGVFCKLWDKLGNYLNWMIVED